ncbi:MAG: hypothetical protein DI539_09370 [Flavobacterium psychrophilum]|nr:MAG: hypothetical protein DI539_09370 [Flavobacterium psychrophilum]
MKSTRLTAKISEDFWFNKLKETTNVISETSMTQFLPSEKQLSVYQSTFSARTCTVVADSCDGKVLNKFKLLMAGYVIVLRHYFKGKKFTIGTTAFSFPNVVSTELPDNVFFPVMDDGIVARDVLRQVHAWIKDIYSYPDAEPEKLISLLEANESNCKDALYNYTIRYNNANHWKEFYRSSGFNLDIIEEESTITVICSFDTDVHREREVEGFCRLFECSLEWLCTDLERELSSFQHVVDSLNIFEGPTDLDTLFPEDATIVSLFRECARRFDGCSAVGGNGKFLTYGELDKQSDRLAGYLLQRSSNTTLVGLLHSKTEEAIVAILGILKAGMAYVPIDPNYPEERIRYIIEDAGLDLVITDDVVSAKVVGENLCVTKSDWDSFADTRQLVKSRPRDAAYVIYTSGSTGRPKGVIVEHVNVVRLLFNNKFQFEFSQHDTWLLFHSLAFDFSVWEIFGALLYGGKLIVTATPIKDPLIARDVITTEGVTVLNQVPSYFVNLLPSILDASPIPTLPLRYVIFGGEALHPATLGRFHAEFPNIKLVNMYGITETTVHVSYKHITKSEIAEDRSNIGMPIPTLGICLLDDYGQLVPPGMTGEMGILGAGVARGYLNNPELTHERFIQLRAFPGRTIYRSGDLAVVNTNGDYLYLGRKDTQVKVRGFRIELSEIEIRMRAWPEVEDALCVVYKDNGDSSLVLYYISRQPLDAEGIKEFLAAELPAFMMPSYYVNMEKFPTTGNNKVDISRLPDPKSFIKEEITDDTRSSFEERLVIIWKRVLGLDHFSIDANFFTVGGDSIKAIRLIAHIAKEMNVSIEVKDVFLNPTLRRMAAFIAMSVGDTTLNAERGAANEMISKIRLDIMANPTLRHKIPSGTEDFYPTGDIQKGMLFLGIISGNEGTYHDQLYFQITAPDFDYSTFCQAVQYLTDKHEILRTSFNLTDFNVELQFVHQYLDCRTKLRFEDLSSLGKDEQRVHLRELLIAERENSFDLANPGLWQMYVCRLTTNEIGLLFECHHAIIDGWSEASFMTELSQLYYKLKIDPDEKPKKLEATFRDYIVDQYRIKSTESYLNFWKEYLSDYVIMPLPLSVHTNFSALPSSKRFAFQLGETLTGEVSKLARSYSVSVRDIHLAAFSFFLHALTGRARVTFGVVSNARPDIPDGDKILGCFLNTIPFKIDLPDDIIIYELIRLIHREAKTLKLHDKLSLSEIIDSAGIKGTTKSNPLFDIIFNFTDFHIYNDSPTEVQSAPALIEGFVSTNTPLDFDIRVTPRFTYLHLNYSEIFSSEQIARMAELYNSIITSFVYRHEESFARHLVYTPTENAVIDIVAKSAHASTSTFSLSSDLRSNSIVPNTDLIRDAINDQLQVIVSRHEFSDSNSIADLAMLVQQKQGLLQLDQTEFTMPKRRSVILPKES